MDSAEAAVTMAHEAEISVPDIFVVLQGINGDGLSNTIDTFPIFMEDEQEYATTAEEQEESTKDDSSDFQHVSDTDATQDNNVLSYDSSSDEADDAAQQSAAEAPERKEMARSGPSPRSPLMMGGYNSLLANNPPSISPLVLDPSTRSKPTGAAAPPAVAVASVVPEDSFIVVPDETSSPESSASRESSDRGDERDRQNMPATRPQASQQRPLSQAEQAAISKWKTDCRNREVRQRKDWCSLKASTSIENGEQLWWQKGGRLAVFASLPRKSSSNGVKRTVSGSLAPGSTVVGIELICLDSTTLLQVDSKPPAVGGFSSNMHPRGRRGLVQMLRIESPEEGFVVLSLDGYSFLGPGFPSTYADPHVWIWRVICPDGAYVRKGLELVGDPIDIIPYGSFVRVTRKTVNTMGLSRLRIHALLEESKRQGEGQGAGTAAAHRSRIVEGWISEALNPLSGQRGPIVLPVPFPVPALYRVTLPTGAIIRSDVELSSPQIGHAPLGAVLKITGRAFSDHPMEQCIERLKLAGCGGWVSVRLNRPPPLDELVFEMIGIDGSFDPESPGLFHLDAYERVQQEHQEVLDEENREPNLLRRVSTIGDLSSVNEEDNEEEERGSSSSPSESSPRPASSSAGAVAVPTLFRCGIASGAQQRLSSTGPTRKRGFESDERCLVCLTEERNSTIVHGETGHIACCLACARILKARGDRCPVCRLPIDSVIQQFWA